MMELNLTLAAIEEFEDTAGVGLLGLFDGDETAIKSRWTVQRLKLMAKACGSSDDEIADWLQPPRLVEAQADAIVQMMSQLTPAVEADEYLDSGAEAGESTGNSPSDAG